jgi:hypothetical protein
MRQKKLSRRALLRGGLALGGAATLAGLAALPAISQQTFAFGLSRYRRPLPGLTKPLRLVQLSDLHFGPYIGAGLVKAWVDAALSQSPDLIVLTGDFIDAGSGRAPLNWSQRPAGEGDDLLGVLKRLQAPLGVYGVWGNHDLALPQLRRLSGAAMAQAGIRMLVNQGLYLRPDLYLGGIDDVWLGQPDIELALGGHRSGASLLLAHEPDILPFVHPDVGLTLCGHTHGGQIVLPLIGAPWTPALNNNGQRFRGGWYSSPVNALVSRGLGVTGVPLRLNAPAEVVVLDLYPI